MENSIRRIEFINKQSLAETPTKKLNVLDIGGHWLLNSIIFAKQGHNVYAADIYEQIEPDNRIIPKIAHDFNIKLVNYNSLQDTVELLSLEDVAFDLVVFSEIIEHLTFNPVQFWKVIYKVLKPKGRIVITTPNFYFLPHLLKNLMRILIGNGVTPTVDHILKTNTYGHHWKLYTRKEISEYFSQLSPDFRIGKSCFFKGASSRTRVRRVTKDIWSYTVS